MFLECKISKPDVQVIWLKDNEEIYTEVRRRKCVEKHVHRLIVEDVTNTDTGVYKCVFEDSCTTCTVTVEERQTPTEFLQTLSDICIEDKSGSASFQCKINKVSVDVKWYHGSQILSPSEKYQLVDEGPIHILKIHNVVDKDEGTYHIVADGQTSSAMLNIEDTEEERELIRQYLAEKRKSEYVLFYY
ncbi:obscurin-like [Mercenaria mercenaria]|uniref:obscurin-like n=1 Tax=Mercenaria mercenaria TaxID=6596 RepID=UPI00234E7F8F|nr:obscurin-like [Mercenaria mercenaria]